MTLNSLDVQNKTFNLQWRGYNKQEVDEFLQIIVNDYDEMTQKLKDNDRDMKSKDERLQDFDNMRDSLNRSLVVAQDAADNVKSQARMEADKIVQEANQRAEQILDAAQREAGRVLSTSYDDALKLVHESDELRRRNLRGYHQRLTLLIEGQLANLKSPEWEESVKGTPVAIGDSEEKLREIVEHTNKVFISNDETLASAEAVGKQPSDALSAPVSTEAKENKEAAAPVFPPIEDSSETPTDVASSLSEEMAAKAVNGETLENFAQGLNPKPADVASSATDTVSSVADAAADVEKKVDDAPKIDLSQKISFPSDNNFNE